MPRRPSRPCRLLFCTLATASLLAPLTASAQPLPDTGGRVFGLVGGSFGDGGSVPLVAGGAGLRVSRHLGLDLEVVHLHDLELSEDDFFIQDRPRLAILAPYELLHDGGLTAFTTRLTVEFPVAGDRLVPFVTGGGGVGRVAETVGFRCRNVCPAALEDVRERARPAIFPLPPIERHETGLSVVVGGGLDVRLWRGLGVGTEVRWMRVLLNRRDLDVAHVTARVSYRF